ncbi:MAG: thermonuclease family protein [Rubrivivax sp.]|nr:thermonuclease family protein [Rubrivivax sp.]
MKRPGSLDSARRLALPLAFSFALGLAGAAAVPEEARAQAAPAASARAGALKKGEGIAGVISRVIDGDTLTLQPPGRPPIEVRLRDIDAPEICQDYGVEAKKALEGFALGKPATLTFSAHDSYGRAVGGVVVEGQSLSKWMVAEGHAWSTRTRFDRGPLMKEERMATALRRGVHATSGAVMPKEFRKTHGPCPRPRRRPPRLSSRRRRARRLSRAPSAAR